MILPEERDELIERQRRWASKPVNAAGPVNAALPVVSSGEWVDALRAISASVEGIRKRAEYAGNMDLALDAAAVRASLVSLRRHIESASTG